MVWKIGAFILPSRRAASPVQLSALTRVVAAVSSTALLWPQSAAPPCYGVLTWMICVIEATRIREVVETDIVLTAQYMSDSTKPGMIPSGSVIDTSTVGRVKSCHDHQAQESTSAKARGSVAKLPSALSVGLGWTLFFHEWLPRTDVTSANPASAAMSLNSSRILVFFSWFRPL